jgi:hypothetical protein
MVRKVLLIFDLGGGLGLDEC